MLKTGFIGGGNMAFAMVGGLVKGGVLPPEDILVSDLSPCARSALEQAFAVKTSTDNRALAQMARFIVLAVKPQQYQSIIDEIKDVVLADKQKVVITIAPGWTLARLESAFGGPLKLVRTMPNTPALVGEGMSAACKNELVTPDEMEQVVSLIGSYGRVEVVPEALFDAFTALCACSPAFVFMMIEAMADAAVREGFARDQAYALVSQAVLGSARMVLETGKHPAQLKDMVCSPGGSTIEGVCALEESGFRAAIFQAIERAASKNREL